MMTTTRVTVRLSFTKETRRGPERKAVEFAASERELEAACAKRVARLSEQGAYAFDIVYERGGA